ncbi:MAG: hypothetical protein K2X52_00535 [Mycobacteriaceae bacterium]|jgi:hypothetical protein|nr:hypothetical protein [Mycobacteriaceae bacterium]
MAHSTLDRPPLRAVAPLPDGADTTAPPVGSGVVAVVTVRPRLRLRHRQARCTCGWSGRRRWGLKGIVTVEALSHAYRCRCVPRTPLIVEAAPMPAGAR